jgi:hypothetical protein
MSVITTDAMFEIVVLGRHGLPGDRSE